MLKQLYMIRCALILLLSVLSESLPAQTNTKNYIQTITYTGVGGTLPVKDITYTDGFGRPLQEIAVGASPVSGKDIIQVYQYGLFGRTDKNYLPYAKSNTGAFVDLSAAYNNSNWSAYGPADQAYAYSLTEYDHSPLNRIVRQTGPGASWHIGSKSLHTTYSFNTPGEVRLYRIATDGSLIADGTYAAGSLEKNTATDEDGHTTETFTDNWGQTILTVTLNGTDRLETYFIYDDRGLQCWVLSPEASSRLGSGTDLTTLTNYAYSYTYDRWGRQTVKRLPGCEPIYMIYDNKDRLVLSQDGNQRTANTWSYALYDGKNRTIETGETVQPGKTHAQLQAEVSVSDNYTPSGARTALQYAVYDNYHPTPTVTAQPFAALPGYDSSYHPHITGLLTSVKSRILGTDIWLTTTLYYDTRCREIQRVSNNLTGGESCISLSYDFVGNILKIRETYSRSVGETDVTETENSYDTRSRLLTTKTTLNGGSPAQVNYTYDALGRLTGKTYGTGGTAFTETLACNIRGWLTEKSSPAFTMKLRYHSPVTTTAACYNGNISEWEWRQGTSPSEMYGYSYDGFSRLLGAAAYIGGTSGWTANTVGYTEKGLSYDLNGNIKTLQRTYGSGTALNYAYSYTGNQLTHLEKEGISGNYTYDANGNMINDSRKSLNFNYNSLNLLNMAETGGVVKAKYSYLSDGSKLRVRDGNDANGYDYLGSLIYRQNSAGLQLEGAAFFDGRILTEGSGNRVYYFLTDHLGSVRSIVDGTTGEVTERNDYYPFGGRHVKSGNALSDNRFKYNGKEVQRTGDLGYLDYGSRMYDMELGRWFGMDPLAEKYYGLSSYNYCGNNPVLLVDPNGTFLTHYVDKDYNSILHTNDGSDDVVMVPDSWLSTFSSFAGMYFGGDHSVFDSRGWNNHWKTEFGLADIQFSSEQLSLLDRFTTRWSRDNAASYMLKPTLDNALLMGLSEGLSQWTNPELVAAGLSAGMAGFYATSRSIVYRVYGGDAMASGFSWTPRNPWKVENFRNIAGLPSGGASGSNNMGRFVIKGIVNNRDIIKMRSAIPLDGNKGGLPEYIIDSKNIIIKRVLGVNPNF